MNNVGQNSHMYRFDFARNFYPSPEAELAERLAYHRLLAEFENLRGRVADTADLLLQALQLYDQVMEKFMRHYTYHYLRYAVDTTNTVSKTIWTQLGVEFTQRTGFLKQELIQADASDIHRFMEQSPGLWVYRHAVESARRFKPHTLSAEEESILALSEPVSSPWEYDLYELLLQRTEFGSLEAPEGELEVLKDRLAITSHPDPTIRLQGFTRLYAGYASQRQLYAFALIHLVKARNQLARLHHFEDAPSEVYFNSYWSKAEVTQLLERIGQQAGVYQHYQRLRLKRAQDMLGKTEVNLWDLAVSPAGQVTPRFTIEQACATIRDALSPMGAAYGRELESLLDPANGRMDILPGKNRKSGGFSKGFPGVTTVFFCSSFEGFYNDLRVLMHESTHAVHRQLMNNRHVRATYADGPHYLFESFAILNELLLADYLLQHETNRAKRQFYLEQFLEGKGMALFFITADASLEQSIYDEVEQGHIQTADDLNALTKRNNRRFDIWIEQHPELEMRWITNRLFYEDPLYNINYVYGSLLALKFYAMLKQSPQSFVENYIALMSNGFDSPPEDLLDRFLKLDLGDPQLLSEAVEILEDKVNQLEQSYLLG